MISTRNLLSSPTSHLSTLLSLSSSSSSLSSSSSSSNNPSNNISNAVTISNISNHQHIIDLSDLAISLNLIQQQASSIDHNNNDLHGYDLNLINSFFSANKININQDANVFSTILNTELKSDHLDIGTTLISPTLQQFNGHDLSIQRRNSSFQSSPQEENEEIINENFNLIRKRFNSVGSHMEMSFGWPDLQNVNSQSGMQDNTIDNYNYRRHNSMFASNEFVQQNRRDQRALSLNCSDLFDQKGFYFGNKNSADQSFMEKNLEKKDLLSRMKSPMANSLTAVEILNNSQVFQSKKQQNQPKLNSIFNCLNPNCNLLSESKSFIILNNI